MASSSPPTDWWDQLKELLKHVFLGAGLFLLLAIPAIALDFFNQGVHLIEVTAAHATPVVDSLSLDSLENRARPAVSEPKVIRVSEPVSKVLEGFEYVLLGVDLVGIGAYLLNTLWTFLRSLKWR